MWWCPPGDVECNFRARRRLGIPLVVALEAKARELEQLGRDKAARTRYRIDRILASEPPARTAEYRAHLGSVEWNAFASEQRLLARYRCEDCDGSFPDLTCHHLAYERLGRELPIDIVVLCRGCHLRWDEARRAYYREHEYLASVSAELVYGALLTEDVRARISERCAMAAAVAA
jgi:hypothetical protein